MFNHKGKFKIVYGWEGNIFCIPESFNTNISHQIFDYTITFLNKQHLNTNSKGDFVLKIRF